MLSLKLSEKDPIRQPWWLVSNKRIHLLPQNTLTLSVSIKALTSRNNIYDYPKTGPLQKL